MDSGTVKQPAGERRARQVLVVDDDPIMREVMCEQLAEIGFNCTAAENGEAGRETSNRLRFDLAIIDITMPKLDGFSLLRHMRQHPRTVDLPVIVCTAHNDRSSIERAYMLGASSFVTKPINWPQFAHHVQFVLRNGETEKALRQAQIEALAASRMKNGLFQVLSHELKTPLTALIGLTEVLSEQLDGRVSADERESLGHVVDGAQRLNAIVSDILLLSKALGNPSQQKLVSVPIAELLDDGLVGQKSLARERQVKLLLRPMEDNFVIACDPHLLRQAIARLVNNAIKFSQPGGAVEVWAHRRADGSTLISVKDSGPGLSPARLQECLKPFMQDDMTYARPVDGLGLGLPIAKAICEAHGGELLIQTALGQGLVAAISLPPQLTVSATHAA
ncbi:MAG: hybrid sensor histidine kinase/response regulator [Hyphomicrobiales bacterium]|jgi:signal transduction histidine kinase